MTQPATDRITIIGARENNLKNITVQIPKHAITVFTGVSGSGKSSLVFDTIAAEAQRQLNETFTAFARARLPKYGQPDLDSIDNLSAAVIVDQKRLGGGSRSTVGTITDIAAILRLLFSRAGQPHLGPSNKFSFNDPQGMCPECEGIGRTTTLNLDRFIDRNRSLNDGALLHPDFQPTTWYWKMYQASGYFDLDKPLTDYTTDEWHKLLHHTGKVPLDIQGSTMNATYEGVVEKFNRLYIRRDTSQMSDRTRTAAQHYITETTCPTCRGTRLNEAARNCRIDGYSIADLTAMEADELVAVLRLFTDETAAPIVDSLRHRVGNLIDIGLGYLSLNRETATLSGGESQRIKMVRHLSSALVEMLYIFDEPSIGLHARDVTRLNTLLRKLRDKGNTVLVVEHDRDVIDIADHIIDLGPGAGTHGGEIVFEGTLEALPYARTPTGRHMRHRLPSTPTSAPPPAPSPSPTPTPTTSKNSPSTSPPASSPSSPASPAPAKAPSSTPHSSPNTPPQSSSTRPPSAPPPAPPPPPTPASWTTSAPSSPKPTRSTPACSASTPKAPAPNARASASSTPTSPSWKASKPPAKNATAPASAPKSSATPSAATPSPTCST